MLLSPLLTLALVMAAPLQIGEVPPPTLNAGSLAIVGEELTFVLEGTTVVPAVTELLLIDFALLPAPVQIAPYGDFFLAIGPGFEVIPGDGTSAWKIPIPNDPALVGLPIHAQALGFVYQAFFGAVKLSNLASVEIQAEPPGAARIAVVANLEDGSLTFQGVDVEGARSRHIGVHLEDDSARALAATSDGSRLFAVDSSNERLVTFEVDGGTGAWNRLGDAPTGALPLDVVVDPSDRFVYAANALGNSISQYALDANGLPQPLTPAELATSSTPSSISIDPSGRWLFAVAAASNLILVHAIDSATGALSLQSAFPIDGSPARLAIGHGGTVVHVLNPASNSITSWSFDTETGQIGALIGQPVAAPPGAVDLTMGSEQKHLYVVDSASSELLWFDVSDEDGGVAPTPEGSVPTAEGSLAVVADPRGERLFVTGIGSNELWIHAPEEATGNPIFVQRLRQRGLPADVVLLLGSQPTAMQSRLVLVGHEGSDEIRAYQLDKELGVIVDLGAGAMTSGPGHVGLALDRRTGTLISAEEQGGVGGYLFSTENGDLMGTGQAASGTQPT
ncbi:MAG: beta-propeller fold lactonase family protein, partial [Planctomycetota bacterium]